MPNWSGKYSKGCFTLGSALFAGFLGDGLFIREEAIREGYEEFEFALPSEVMFLFCCVRIKLPFDVRLSFDI